MKFIVKAGTEIRQPGWVYETIRPIRLEFRGEYRLLEGDICAVVKRKGEEFFLDPAALPV